MLNIWHFNHSFLIALKQIWGSCGQKSQLCLQISHSSTSTKHLKSLLSAQAHADVLTLFKGVSPCVQAIWHGKSITELAELHWLLVHWDHQGSEQNEHIGGNHIESRVNLRYILLEAKIGVLWPYQCEKWQEGTVLWTFPSRDEGRTACKDRLGNRKIQPDGHYSPRNNKKNHMVMYFEQKEKQQKAHWIHVKFL